MLPKNSEMKIIEINKIDDLEPYGEVWDELVNKNKIRYAELTFDWNIEWFRHCCKDSKLKVLIAEEKNKIVGIAPLMVSRVRDNNELVNRIEFIAAHVSNYADFIIPEENKKQVLKALYNYLDERCGDFDEINLDFIQEVSSTMEILKKTPSKNLNMDIKENDVALTLSVDRTWDKFISKRKSTRHNVRNNINNIKKLGKLSFNHYTDYDSINLYLDVLFKYKKEVLGLKGIPSIFEDKNTINFFKSVSKKLSSKNRLDLAVLKLNGHPISLLYTLIHDKSYLLNVISFDLNYSKYSPGKMAIYLLAEDIFKNGFVGLDLGRGPDRWKYFWTNNEIKLFNVDIKKKNGN